MSGDIEAATGRGSLTGVFPVLATPFDADNRIDVRGLRRIVRLVMAAGANGIVYPANASEFDTLTREEREAMLEVVFEHAGGRLPVIIGASAGDAREAAELAGLAATFGASAVMVMPPSRLADDVAGLQELFQAVARVVDVPLILQNAPPPLGPALPPSLIVKLLAAIPAIGYVKEECLPSGARITSLLGDAPATLIGVFGGAGGRYIMGELARGITGCMPSCECTEIHAAILGAYRRGQEAQARAIFDQLVPLLNFVSVFRAAGVKEVLHQRGIIDCARHRGARIPALDDDDRRELAALIANMQHLWDAESLRTALA